MLACIGTRSFDFAELLSLAVLRLHQCQLILLLALAWLQISIDLYGLLVEQRTVVLILYLLLGCVPLILG